MFPATYNAFFCKHIFFHIEEMHIHKGEGKLKKKKNHFRLSLFSSKESSERFRPSSARQSSQYHAPLGGASRPTHSIWNHSYGQFYAQQI